MKLWKLARTDEIQYDEYDSFVIRADSDGTARRIASEHCGGEGPAIWLSVSLTSCVQLTDAGEAGVVLDSYFAG